VHGGGNTVGTTSDPLYDGQDLVAAGAQDLAARSGSVVVTVEYRLGALGFFTHPGLDAESEHNVSGNYGILDQIAALRWVQDNIAGFGGDPSRVLLFGESAGAVDTLIHVASPLSHGLFAAAAAESGAAYETTIAQGQTAMQGLVTAVGCDTASDVVACMRGKTATELAAVPSATGPLDHSGFQYLPVVDGYVLPANVYDTLAAGTHNHVPLIIGTNADETGKMVADVQTAAAYAAAVRAQYGNFLGSLLLTQFPASDYPSPRKALVRVTTDTFWTCPIRNLARLAAAHQAEPVYRYQFTWKAPTVQGFIDGSFHGLELPFVFGTAATALNYTPTTQELGLSEAMQRYWSRLAANGVPNGGSDVVWPVYDVATDPYLVLDTTISTNAGLETEHCDFIDKLGGQ
jgi:para-nitrobenzyl esterase